MADLQVRCTEKHPRNNTHEGIQRLAGDGGGGWNWSKGEVITYIELGIHTFYTYVAGKRANVAVVQGANGKYLRTHADGVWTDNLLALPQCVYA